jgi:hypothetical protein
MAFLNRFSSVLFSLLRFCLLWRLHGSTSTTFERTKPQTFIRPQTAWNLSHKIKLICVCFCVCAVSIAQEKPEAEQQEGGVPVSAIGQEPIQYPQPVVQQHIVQIQAPQPAAVTVSGPLDNLLKSLTADIAQDNLAIDALRTQVRHILRFYTFVSSTRVKNVVLACRVHTHIKGLSVNGQIYVVMIMVLHTMNLSLRSASFVSVGEHVCENDTDAHVLYIIILFWYPQAQQIHRKRVHVYETGARSANMLYDACTRKKSTALLLGLLLLQSSLSSHKMPAGHVLDAPLSGVLHYTLAEMCRLDSCQGKSNNTWNGKIMLCVLLLWLFRSELWPMRP